VFTKCDMLWPFKARYRRTAFFRGGACDKAGYHSNTNTHFVVYWYTEGNTDLHEGDVIVIGGGIVTFMYDGTCNSMSSSTRIVVGGAGPHNNIWGIVPVDSKILMFVFSIQVIEFYILYPIRNLVKNILNIYIQCD